MGDDSHGRRFVAAGPVARASMSSTSISDKTAAATLIADPLRPHLAACRCVRLHRGRGRRSRTRCRSREAPRPLHRKRLATGSRLECGSLLVTVHRGGSFQRLSPSLRRPVRTTGFHGRRARRLLFSATNMGRPVHYRVVREWASRMPRLRCAPSGRRPRRRRLRSQRPPVPAHRRRPRPQGVAVWGANPQETKNPARDPSVLP